MSENENTDNEDTTAESLRNRFMMKPNESDARVAFYEMGYAARMAEEEAERVTVLRSGRRNWTHFGVGLIAAALSFVLGMTASSPSRDGASIARTKPAPRVEATNSAEGTVISNTPTAERVQAIERERAAEPDRLTESGGFPSVRSIDFVWNAAPSNFTLTAGGLRLDESATTAPNTSTWRASRALSDFETEI